MTSASNASASPCIDPLTSEDTLAVIVLTSCSSAEARSWALTASSPVTPVTLLIPFATAVSSLISRDMRANVRLSVRYDIWRRECYSVSKLPSAINGWSISEVISTSHKLLDTMQCYVDKITNSQQSEGSQCLPITTCDNKSLRLSSVRKMYATAELYGAAHPIFLRRVR